MSNTTFQKIKLAEYLPLFLIVCFSGNPLITAEGYSKALLVVFSGAFILFTFIFLTPRELNKTIGWLIVIILFILLLSLFQFYALGFVSFPGVLALILKISIGFFMLMYYRHKNINPMHLYIKIMSFLALVSLPFFALNFFVHTGYQLDSPALKSLFFYTSYDLPKDMLRNSGMFWEPGAFAGYLTLALLFIAIVNGKFTIGPYKRNVFWIFAGLLSTMSTTGFLILGLVIVIYVFQNYKYGKYIMIPVLAIAGYFAYNNLEFLNDKIEEQYQEAKEMDATDVSNTRFGALNMDLEYIEDKPLIGNGLDKKTRYRFHPWIEDEIGHGNGMSNFIVWWGIPLFCYWVFCLYRFVYKNSHSAATGILVALVILLMLQGEQFLNYPLFLIFFTAPAVVFESPFRRKASGE